MDISVLVYVLLIIAFGKALGEIVSRINQPSIVGELLAGIILGPFILGKIFSELGPMYQDEFIKGLADLGILLLMLYIGLEFSPKRLITSSYVGTTIAVSGIVVPMVLGFIAGYLFGLQGATLIFLSIAVSVTALPVTIRILKDMEVVQTETGSRIISAAMITDICLLFAMGIVLGGQTVIPTTGKIFYLAMGYILFFALAFIVSRYIVPQLYRLLKWMQTGEAAFAIAIGVAILFAVAADFVGLPSFIGAFIAGMILRETGTGLRVWARVEDILSGVTLGFLAPIFFVIIGFSVDFGAIFASDASLIWLFFMILIIAISGKLIGTVIAARLSGIKKNESLAIGSMMMGKGAMELVFAQIALESGLIGKDIFSMLVLMAFISTALAPVLFKYYFNKAIESREIPSVKPVRKPEFDYDPGL